MMVKPSSKLPATTVLAATIHDSAGILAPAIARLAPVLTSTFSNICLNISESTAAETVQRARHDLKANIMMHPPGEAMIGKIRRDVVAFALSQQNQVGAPILHADFDHMLRWVEHVPSDLSAILRTQPDVDFLVIGRSPSAMAREPKRLQETERLVNYTFELLTGHRWDLLFAIRRFSPQAAKAIVSNSEVETMANDVEWPLLARRLGLRLGYAQSDDLYYRTIEEFGADVDTQDNDPLQWVRRLEFAALQAAAMRPYLEPDKDAPPS